MRSLFISRLRPDAAGSGGQQRRHSTLSALRRLGEVDQLILGYDPAATTSDELYLPSLNQPRVPSINLLPFVDPKLVRIAQGWSGNIARLDARDRATLGARIAAGDYDLVFANRAMGGLAVLSSADTPPLLTDFDDMISDVLAVELRTRGRSLGLQSMLAQGIEAKLVSLAEGKVARASATSFVCSESDRAKLASRYPGTHVVILPNVSQAPFTPLPDPDGKLHLLFVGSLDYEPNQDAVTWFLEAIWPTVRDALGDQVSLAVVGRGSDEIIATFPKVAGASYHLNVPSLAPFYAAADACIVPVRYGGGTSIKTIEAMAAGRPILSTPVGMRGLGMVDGTDHLAFTDAGEFVAACRRLIDEPGLAPQLVAAAHGLWEDRFSQAAVDRVVASCAARAMAKEDRA